MPKLICTVSPNIRPFNIKMHEKDANVEIAHVEAAKALHP